MGARVKKGDWERGTGYPGKMRLNGRISPCRTSNNPPIPTDTQAFTLFAAQIIYQVIIFPGDLIRKGNQLHVPIKKMHVVTLTMQCPEDFKTKQNQQKY